MRVAIVCTIFASAIVLAGCKDTDRPLSYTKGEYGGKADTKLSAEQVETLRQRGMRTYR